jgi:hypothetical protein
MQLKRFPEPALAPAERVFCCPGFVPKRGGRRFKYQLAGGIEMRLKRLSRSPSPEDRRQPVNQRSGHGDISMNDTQESTSPDIGGRDNVVAFPTTAVVRIVVREAGYLAYPDWTEDELPSYREAWGYDDAGYDSQIQMLIDISCLSEDELACRVRPGAGSGWLVLRPAPRTGGPVPRRPGAAHQPGGTRPRAPAHSCPSKRRFRRARRPARRRVQAAWPA